MAAKRLAASGSFMGSTPPHPPHHCQPLHFKVCCECSPSPGSSGWSYAKQGGQTCLGWRRTIFPGCKRRFGEASLPVVCAAFTPRLLFIKQPYNHKTAMLLPLKDLQSFGSDGRKQETHLPLSCHERAPQSQSVSSPCHGLTFPHRWP